MTLVAENNDLVVVNGTFYPAFDDENDASQNITDTEETVNGSSSNDVQHMTAAFNVTSNATSDVISAEGSSVAVQNATATSNATSDVTFADASTNGVPNATEISNNSSSDVPNTAVVQNRSSDEVVSFLSDIPNL